MSAINVIKRTLSSIRIILCYLIIFYSFSLLITTLREEIFAGINFREFLFGHFAGIIFRELGFTQDFAGINFRELSLTKNFAGINFRNLSLTKDFLGVNLTFALRNIFPRP